MNSLLTDILSGSIAGIISGVIVAVLVPFLKKPFSSVNQKTPFKPRLTSLVLNDLPSFPSNRHFSNYLFYI